MFAGRLKFDLLSTCACDTTVPLQFKFAWPLEKADSQKAPLNLKTQTLYLVEIVLSLL